MVKRGQVSIFLIVALIIIILLSLTYFLKLSIPKIQKQEIAKASKTDLIRADIQSCLNNVANSAIYSLGLQGGYTEKPDKFLTINNSIIAFGYYKNAAIINSLKGLESELNSYIEKNLPLCVSEERLIFEQGSVISKVIINENDIKIEVSYPIRIKQEDRVESLPENYQIELKIRLGYVYNFILSIIQKQLRDPLNIDIANLLKSDLTIDVVGYKDNVLIYLITDKKSKINNKPFVFIFANYFGT